MEKKRIIPCLDVDKGRLVKGVQFKGLKELGDPVEFAQRYEKDGADEIIFLDVSAGHEGRATRYELIEEISQAISIPLSVGGGIRSLEDAEHCIAAGAKKVVLCSSALKEPSLLDAISKKFGKEALVLSIDSKRLAGTAKDTPRWNAYSAGGRVDSGRDVIEWAKEAASRGVGEIVLNSMDSDGTAAGYDLALIRAVKAVVSIPVIASSGAGTLEHIWEALRPLDTDGANADAALVASMVHFGKVTVQEIKEYLKEKGVNV